MDKWIGIPKGEIDQIFEPFYRCSNVIGKNGHGIGLSLVKKIIELHNGVLKIESQINSGTNISIFLPYW
jgi:signal transduction histidine kinase